MGSHYKFLLNEFVGSLHVKGHTVLDWGGAQNPAKGRTASWDVDDYKIVDLQTPHVELQKPDIVQDANMPLNGDIEEYIGKVDLLLCFGLFDYVINPNIAMESVSRLLKKGGEAWIEYVFIYPIHNPIDDEGCRYSEGCIRRLAKQAGLEIKEIIYKRPKPDNPYLEIFYQRDGMRAARGVDHNVTGYIVRMTK